jgi:hypothetical protein
MFEHARDSVFCSHHLSRVLLGIVSRDWSQDTLDNDSKDSFCANGDRLFCAGLALPDCMKLAEDGDDWGMLVPAALSLKWLIESMSRCQAGRGRAVETTDARPLKEHFGIRKCGYKSCLLRFACSSRSCASCSTYARRPSSSKSGVSLVKGSAFEACC